MDMNFLIRGVIIGFSIASIIGPIGILCIKRSLSNGILSGFISGLGAATVDGLYGLIAAFGLTVISNFLLNQKIWIQSIGIIFLIYLGIKTFIEKPKKEKNVSLKKNNLLGDYFSIFILTLTNPMTILSFLAIFAGLGLANTTSFSSASLVVLGVFLGSLFLYLILSFVFGFSRKNLNESILKWINRIAGLIILIFAGFIIYSMLKG